MRKSIETPHATGLSNAAIVDAAKRQIGVQEMHHGLIDTCITCTGLAEYFINTTLVGTVNVQRQWFWFAVNISHHFANI